MMCLTVFIGKQGFCRRFKKRGIILLIHTFLNCNSAGNGHTDHRVVAGTDKTHHFYVKYTGADFDFLTAGM